MFRRFFAEGAFNQAFVPIYADFQKNNDVKETKNYLNSIAGFLITFLFFFSILVLIFAPIFILIFAPGFYFDPTKIQLNSCNKQYESGEFACIQVKFTLLFNRKVLTMIHLRYM